MSVTYHAPTIGPKFYTARGTSGWVESFPRDRADKALQAMLGKTPIKVAVDGFRNSAKLAQRRGIEWSWILDYLVKITGMRSDLVTDEVGVAFWCQILLADREAMN